MERRHRTFHREAPIAELLLPFIPWLKEYSRESLKKDALAGVTVAAVLTPQAMAFAMIAGLPPIMGFYAALFGSIVASLWGSSPKLSTGPVAIISLLTFSTLVPLAEPGSGAYIMLASALAVLSGLILFAVGLYRFGFIVRVIPHSVITGFAVSAAIIIAITQLPALLGFAVERHGFILPTIGIVGLNLVNAHGITVLVGLASVVLLLMFKKFSPRFPAALLVLALATAASFAFRLDELGVAVVGPLEAILPALTIPALTVTGWFALLSKAWIIALVSFVESYAIARSLNESARERIDVNQELVGQGLANMAVGFFRGYPVSGSFSRTAVNVAAGAQTGIASIFAGITVLAALLLIAPLFAYIPLAVLAAIVIVSILDFIDIEKLRYLYNISRTDGIVALTTFFVALIMKPDDAVAVGIIVALVLFLRRIVFARVRILGVEREWGILQGVGTSENIETFKGVLILRIETAAFYGNIDHIIRTVDDLILEEHSKDNAIDAIVLDCSSVNYIDVSGAETLRHYFESLQEQGIKVYSIYMHGGVFERLRRVSAEPYFTPLHNIKEMRAALSLPEPGEALENIVELVNDP